LAEIERLTIANEELNEEKNKIEMELNYYIQENNRMRNRLKEFTKTEIELCDQIELLTEENRLKSQKISAMNLMNRYGDMATPEDV